MQRPGPVRIGLIGCGRIAEFGYLPAFQRARGLKLVAVADVNPSRCRQIAPGLPAYPGVRALIDGGEVDALIIATPTRFHVSDARWAAESGLPALVEKPPGMNRQEARALHDLMPSPWIGFNRRFEPAIANLREFVRRQTNIQLRLDLHYRRSAWRPLDMHDDALLDLGPHLIDLARWLTGGEILSVRALSLTDSRAKFELKLERCNAVISCSNNRPYRERIEVQEVQGRACRSYRRGGIVCGIIARLQPWKENPLVRPVHGQLEAFALGVRRVLNGEPLATAADGLAAMSAVDAVRRSAIQGARECAL